jgi:hypothetical protein
MTAQNGQVHVFVFHLPGNKARPGQASGINHLSGILRAAGACFYRVNISVFVLGIAGVFGCLLLSVPVERGRVGEVRMLPPYPLVVTKYWYCYRSSLQIRAGR